MSPTSVATHSDASEAAIFSRVWTHEGRPLPVVLARHVLKLRFSAEDEARMHELATRNQQGVLSPDESDELDNFVRVGDLLAILQSKARQRLKKPREGVARRGLNKVMICRDVPLRSIPARFGPLCRLQCKQA